MCDVLKFSRRGRSNYIFGKGNQIMEMVKSKESESICQDALEGTDDTQCDLGDLRPLKESPPTNHDLDTSPKIVNGDSGLNDITEPENDTPAPIVATGEATMECDSVKGAVESNPNMADVELVPNEADVERTPDEAVIADCSNGKVIAGNSICEKTDELSDENSPVENMDSCAVKSAEKTNGTDGVGCPDKTDVSLNDVSENNCEMPGREITDSEEDRLLNADVEEVSSVKNDEPLLVEEKENTENSVARSPQGSKTINDPPHLDEDDESLGVEIVPEEKAEIIVREEVDIPMDSPKTDEESGGDIVKDKSDAEEENGKAGSEDETDNSKSNEESKKGCSEDTENCSTNGLKHKSDVSDSTKIVEEDEIAPDDVSEVTEGAKGEESNDACTGAARARVSDEDSDVLLVDEVAGKRSNPSPLELKRRRTSDSAVEEDSLDKPAKKLKKTNVNSRKNVEEDKKIVLGKERNPAKVYVASPERKKQISDILDTIYKNPSLGDVVERFETMMLQAFSEVLVSETSNGKARVAYQKSKDELDQLAKTVTGYRKQKEDLKLVVQKVIDIVKHSRPGDAIVPPKVTRSVGLQVCTVGSMYIKMRDVKKSPAKSPSATVSKPTTPGTLPSPASSSAPSLASKLSTAAKQLPNSVVLRQSPASSSLVVNKNSVVVTNGRQRVVNGVGSNGLSNAKLLTQRKLLPLASLKTNSNITSVTRASPQVNCNTRPANSNIVKKSTSTVSPAAATLTNNNKSVTNKAAPEIVIDLTDKDDEAAVKPRPFARKRTSGTHHGNSITAKKAHPQKQSEIPLPKSPIYPASVVRPPTPSLRLCESQAEGVMLSWQFDSSVDVSKIIKYQLFAVQAKRPSDGSETFAGGQQDDREWKKIGDVDALPLPMACTLTQFKKGSKYSFTVRAVDKDNHVGEFSNVCNSLIK